MPDTLNPYNDCHFTIALLRNLGKQFCQTLVDYSRDEGKVKAAMSELEALNPVQGGPNGQISKPLFGTTNEGFNEAPTDTPTIQT